MSEFVEVAKLEDFDPPEEGIFVETKGKQIALFKIDDQVYAIDEKCSHRAGPLSEGAVIGKEVRCPWHGARFSLETGEPTCVPGRKALNVYEVQVDGNLVKIKV